MAGKVSEMTSDELRDMVQTVVETIVERKLLELLGDPDEGLVLRRRVRDRLLRQRKAVESGERGEDFDEVVRTYGWEQ